MNSEKAYDSCVSVAVKNLSYAVRVRRPGSGEEQKIQVLKDVTLAFRPGQLTAVLGPSGCGKTSLVNMMAGRIPRTNDCSGKIFYNGVSNATPSAFSRYVMQQDHLVEYLTVEETLMFAARMKLKQLNDEERMERVDSVIQELGLANCRHTVVGGHMEKGCSGGERKRVSIALELLEDPRLLFLDEPTTGLDASRAFDTLCILINLARKGRTVICTVHTPRSSVFALFDQIVLLSRGEVVYTGPPSAATGYFGEIGYPCPSWCSPPDFLLDLLTTTADINQNNNLDNAPMSAVEKDDRGNNANAGGGGGIGTNTGGVDPRKLTLTTGEKLQKALKESGINSQDDWLRENSPLRIVSPTALSPFEQPQSPTTMEMGPMRDFSVEVNADKDRYVIPSLTDMEKTYENSHFEKNDRNINSIAPAALQLTVPSEQHADQYQHTDQLLHPSSGKSSFLDRSCDPFDVNPTTLELRATDLAEQKNTTDETRLSVSPSEIKAFPVSWKKSVHHKEMEERVDGYANFDYKSVMFTNSGVPAIGSGRVSLTPTPNGAQPPNRFGAKYVDSPAQSPVGGGSLSGNVLSLSKRNKPAASNIFGFNNGKNVIPPGLVDLRTQHLVMADGLLDEFQVRLSSFGSEFWRLLQRLCLKDVRLPKQLFMGMVQKLFAGVVLGWFYYQLGTEDLTSAENRTALFFWLCLNTTIALNTVLSIFPLNRALINKEIANGMYSTLSYYLAQNIASLPWELLGNTVFFTIIFVMAGLNHGPHWIRFWIYLLNSNLLVFTITGVMTLCSAACLTIEMANICASLLILLFVLTAGFYVNMKNIPLPMRWISYISYFRYAFAVYMVNDLEGLKFKTSESDLLAEEGTRMNEMLVQVDEVLAQNQELATNGLIQQKCSPSAGAAAFAACKKAITEQVRAEYDVKRGDFLDSTADNGFMGDNVIRSRGYENFDIYEGLALLFVLGIGYRVVGYFLFKYLHRKVGLEL